MNFRELLGLILIIGGIVLLPLGWIISSKVLVLSFVFIVGGSWLFYTTRIVNKENHPPAGDQGTIREIRGSSGDIHNYRGTHTGGRREDPETFFDGDDGD